MRDQVCTGCGRSLNFTEISRSEGVPIRLARARVGQPGLRELCMRVNDARSASGSASATRARRGYIVFRYGPLRNNRCCGAHCFLPTGAGATRGVPSWSSSDGSGAGRSASGTWRRLIRMRSGWEERNVLLQVPERVMPAASADPDEAILLVAGNDNRRTDVSIVLRASASLFRRIQVHHLFLLGGEEGHGGAGQVGVFVG